MFLSSLRHSVERTLPASRQVGRRPRSPRLHCEELEPRRVPSAFTFSTGNPDGAVATISEPPDAHNNQVEFESADDFVLPHETVITNATFTGLLTGGATTKDVNDVFITIYRVFPNDSDVTRTTGPSFAVPPNIPTRVNSPADNEIVNRDSAAHELSFHTHVLSKNFTANASVSNTNQIKLKGAGGAVTGEEVQFTVNLKHTPIVLPAGRYFFVPKVGLSTKAPAGSDFLLLSAPKPTPAPADLQSWVRDDPGIAPDWLRIGQDVVDGTPFTAFNTSFSLQGHTVHKFE